MDHPWQIFCHNRGIDLEFPEKSLRAQFELMQHSSSTYRIYMIGFATAFAISNLGHAAPASAAANHSPRGNIHLNYQFVTFSLVGSSGPLKDLCARAPFNTGRWTNYASCPSALRKALIFSANS